MQDGKMEVLTNINLVVETLDEQTNCPHAGLCATLHQTPHVWLVISTACNSCPHTAQKAIYFAPSPVRFFFWNRLISSSASKWHRSAS